MEGDDTSIALVAVRRIENELHGHRVKSPIKLDLEYWATSLAEPDTGQSLSKLETVLEFFHRTASENSLDNLPAFKKLDVALGTIRNLRNSRNFERERNRLSWADRVAHSDESVTVAPVDYNALIQTNPEQAITQLVYNALREVPVFNVWDSMGLIYTLCIEMITTEITAELHLYQFRMIIKWIANHWYYKACSPDCCGELDRRESYFPYHDCFRYNGDSRQSSYQEIDARGKDGICPNGTQHSLNYPTLG